MHGRMSLLVVVSLSLLALPAVGQEEGGNVGMIHCLKVQPSAQVRLEEALKKHVDWHRTQKDTWAWNTWTVVTGPDSDQICTGTFGHKWEDFDNPSVSPEADNADAMATWGPSSPATRRASGSSCPSSAAPLTSRPPCPRSSSTPSAAGWMTSSAPCSESSTRP